MGEPEALREKRWMAAAFHRGWEGVEQVVFHRASSKAADVDKLALKLQSTLASRALEFALELETSGAAPTEADLSRFMAARNVQARQPETPVDQTGAMLTFIRALHGSLEKKADENPQDTSLDPIRELKATLLTAPVFVPQRMRTRFAAT
jgi:hypothetical protein